jgi:glutaredoxin
MPCLVLLSREACHLCHEMEAEIFACLRTHGLPPDCLQTVDIDDGGNEALQKKYNREVPVLLFDGQEICRHRLDLAALEQALGKTKAT